MSKFLALIISISVFSVDYPLFDRGPDPKDPMQMELLDIIQDMPYLPGISQELQVLVPSYKRGQKMRPDFGAMPLRGFLTPNSISVLVIGQDGTHIAEGANRPGIAGFGGRVHDMLKHFGVLEGVLFTNLYVNTISGQYGSRNTPVIKDGKTIEFRNVIENRQWLMTHEGPYGKWRNRFISWVIRNNMKSLRMVMMLGQAGKDAGANFINSIGGVVGARSSVGSGYRYQVPVFKMEPAGGNNEWAVPLTKDGKDVAEVLRQDETIRTALKTKLEEKLSAETKEIRIKALKARIKALDKKLKYSDGRQEYGVSTENAKSLLLDNVEKAKELMSFTYGGPQRNGVLFPQQFGGWDLHTMKVEGQKTRSIKGLSVPCNGSKVGVCKDAITVSAPDIVFVGAPHPTSLSMGEMTKKGSAAIKVEKELLKPLKAELDRGWNPPTPESGMKSAFLEGKAYKYRRGVIPQSHGDPGITDLRLLPVSTAKRQGKSMIVIGTRDRASFSKTEIKKLEKDTPSNQSLVSSNYVLTGRAKFDSWKTKYDRGPNEKYAKLLFQSLNKKESHWVNSKYLEEANKVYDEIFENSYKDDYSKEYAYSKSVRTIFDKYGIDAFSAKTHPDAGFFGHYRGTFDNPKVIIVSDPLGYDSFITSKAATGERGQYLNGLMSDLGVKENYLVLSTVPFAMDGASEEEWQTVIKRTEKYRYDLIKELKSDFPKAIFLADGKYATQEVYRILEEKSYIEGYQTSNHSEDMKSLGKKLLKKFKGSDVTGLKKDIPREHLTWIARVWEGTSGDRVITATDKTNKGKAFAIVAPDWARKNKVYFTQETKDGVIDMISKLVAAGEPQPYEKITDYQQRRSQCASSFELASKDKNYVGLKQCSFSSEVFDPMKSIKALSK